MLASVRFPLSCLPICCLKCVHCYVNSILQRFIHSRFGDSVSISRVNRYVLMNNELEWMRKETDVSRFQFLSQILSGVTEEDD
jgi:hypothetical protein